ncbi:Vegetative incompatibility protein HET-E-1 [Colletotrichum siamense]|nr:Vegetative incompatibility protein HET-E-1 [Colletotrichum siamense]
MTDSSKLSTYKLYTIGWIAALDKELTAALAMLDETHEQPDDFEQNDKDSNTYSWGRNGEHNVVIASLGGGSYGKVSAATTATCMATSFPHLRFGLLVGIGAGIPRLEQDIDIRLGDVVVSVPTGEHPGVVQYDLGKKRDNGRLERVGALNRPPEILLSGINKLRGHQRLNGSKLPQILNEAVRLHPMLGKPKGKDPPFIYQGSQHDRLFESTSMHVETGHGGIQSHSPQPNEVSRNLPQLMYYGLRLTLVWLWTLVYFLLTARKPLDPDVNVIHQETKVARSCLNCDPNKEISRESRQTIDPEIHYGNIASGDLVVKGGLARDLIIQSLGKSFLCFEMEAAGLMNNFPCLVIRGICDYADSHKNDRWQNYAALAAAAYAKELLGAIDARKVERADKMEKIMAEVSDTKQAVQSMNDERLLEKMYAWLSAPDPSVNYHTALSQRHTGTCDWFLHSEQYDRWKRESSSSLWIYGGPGRGKTVLSSVIISDLKAFEDDTHHLLFFFFSFTDSKKQSLDGVVRSLTSQLSRQSKSARAYLTSTFNSKYEKSWEQPSTAQLCEIFECMLQRSNNIWVVLDALDECQLGITFKNEGLLPWLQSLLTPKHDNLRALVTSRREHNIRMVLDGCIAEQLCLQVDLVAGDIQAFIDEIITNWDGLSIWQEHKWVQEEIRDYLTKNSDGMFRWVSCQLDALAPLQGCRDHEALLATLKSLPKSLDGTYARILDQIPEALRAKANRILQFLIYSEAPLYLEEVVEIATLMVLTLVTLFRTLLMQAAKRWYIYSLAQEQTLTPKGAIMVTLYKPLLVEAIKRL